MADNQFWQMIAGRLPIPNAARLLGWQFISHLPQTREMVVSFDASASLTNPLGNIQGGMLTAMLDDCLGPAVYMLLEPNEAAVTVSLSTTFLAPAAPGLLTGIARLYMRKGRYCYVRGELRNAEGKPVATAKGCYKVMLLRGT